MSIVTPEAPRVLHPTAFAAPPTEELVLYGAGNKAKKVLSVLRNNGMSVKAIIDRRSLPVFEGLPVYRPDDQRLRQLAAAGCSAVVGVFNHSVDPLEIHTLLQTIGFRRVIGIGELRQSFSIGETYWLSDSAAMIPPDSTAMWLFKRLRDAHSRKILSDVIALRRTLDPRYLRAISPLDQYMPAGVPTPRKNLRFVDGGAFDGDTLLSLQSAGCTFEAVVAFEPDAVNFKKLTASARAVHVTDSLVLQKFGLGSRSERVRFNSQRLGGSAISLHGDSSIEIVSFDDRFPDFNPTYIKLDIEGAERDALMGMAVTIDSARPSLAVCVYHRPSDLWEIPLLIDKLLPDSDFYLRAHAWNGFDLVLYAVPREKCANS